MRRVIAIHDLCGFGRCSLSVALPVLSAMGVQCCPLPTAYFSTSPNIPGYSFTDLTACAEPALRHWASVGIAFDAVYSGYLAAPAQAELVALSAQLFPRALIIVDPVMGDGGKPYSTCTPGLIAAMRRLALTGDVITPNVTEACILLDRETDGAPSSYDEAVSWMEDLSGGRRSVALTGLRLRDGEVATGWLDAGTGGRGVYAQKFVGRPYHGTGDIFASALTGGILTGKTFGEAAETASRFARDCAAVTYEKNAPESDGVLFEQLLGGLR